MDGGLGGLHSTKEVRSLGTLQYPLPQLHPSSGPLIPLSQPYTSLCTSLAGPLQWISIGSGPVMDGGLGGAALNQRGQKSWNATVPPPTATYFYIPVRGPSYPLVLIVDGGLGGSLGTLQYPLPQPPIYKYWFTYNWSMPLHTSILISVSGAP